MLHRLCQSAETYVASSPVHMHEQCICLVLLLLLQAKDLFLDLAILHKLMS